MTANLPTTASSDASAIAAVLEGDRERFRELVERYEDRVYAVAWSRLGDRSLAEEAAQETFIRAYRKLSLLGGAEKFGHWITTIARHTAINLGMRHRSEIRMRERWSLERVNDDAASDGDSGGEAAPSAEMFSRSLADLPAIHRECLVLFYLEDRGVSEAAALLGLSETAFKTRLHRARHALRAVLESRLEESLAELRPSSQFAGVVMLALPLGKPGLVAFGAAFGTIGTVLPAFAGWLLAPHVPMVLAGWWLDRKTAENYRDQGGFRAREFRKWSRVVWRISFVAAVVSVIWALSVRWGMDRLGASEWARHTNGLTMVALGRGFCGLLAAMYGFLLSRTWRSVALTRHRFVWAEWLSHACLVAGLSGVAVGGSGSWIFLGMAGQQFFLGIAASARPLRMDYSLFVRALRGLLGVDLSTAALRPAPDYSPAVIQGFTRFLGERLLVRDCRTHAGGTELLLNVPGPGNATIWFSWKGSTLILRNTGEVTAHLSEAIDRRIFAKTTPITDAELPELEATVASAVSGALARYAAGDRLGAEAILGESPSASIFLKNPASDAGRVWRSVGYFVLAVAFLWFAWKS
ncbi:MAG: polymerase sigma factor SigW [Verrucomicrobiota bacterium]